MDDYISREAAKNALRAQRHRFTVADEANGYGNVKWSECVIYAETAENAIDAIPATEVKPVGRGKWKWSDDFFETLVCSECGYDTEDRIKQNFCPNCGADMREAEK